MRHYTITTEDVGKGHIRIFGRVWPVNCFLGRILKCDVGKRVYRRGGVLQVENQEQYAARMAYFPPGARMESVASYHNGRQVWAIPNVAQFEINVAWLKFLAEWELGVSGPSFPSKRELRLMRIAFDWAMAYLEPPKPEPVAKTDRLCQALHNHNPADFEAIAKPIMDAMRCECPTGCGMLAVMHLFRVTAYVHESPIYDTLPVDFCEPCGSDALESGLYCVGDDLLEPHHGPDCIKRMNADAGVGDEGGQS